MSSNLNWQALADEFPAFIHHLIHEFELPPHLATETGELDYNKISPVPPENERKVVRRIRGRTSTVTLSRRSDTFFVTLSTAFRRPITLQIQPKTKTEAIEAARFFSWMIEQTNRHATADAAGIIARSSFSKS